MSANEQIVPGSSGAGCFRLIFPVIETRSPSTSPAASLRMDCRFAVATKQSSGVFQGLLWIAALRSQ